MDRSPVHLGFGDAEGPLIDHLISLHEEVLDFVAHVSPTKDEMGMRADIVSRVTEVVTTLWPSGDIQVTGSYATGLYLPDSDIDLVVRGRRHTSATEPAQATGDASASSGLESAGCPAGVGAGDLHSLAEALADKGLARLEQIHVIRGAKIPIVKFTEAVSNVGVDIAFDVDGSTATSDMIRIAAEHHASLRPLAMVLKTFLKQRCLNELFRGGLSSYGLLIMIIHFLQLYPVKPATRRALHENTLGFEVMQFLKLYAYDFEYSNVICVREGGWAFPKKSRGWHDELQPDALAIEDPLFLDCNIGEGAFCYAAIRAQFAEAFERLVQSEQPALSSILIPRSYEALDNRRRSALTRWRMSNKRKKRSPATETDSQSEMPSGDVKLTYMLRNIPNKYTRKTLLQDIDAHFQGTYDFFYLPIDFKQNCNRGYAFINFTCADAALAFREAYQGCTWTRFNSEKIGAVSPAHIQGQSQLISHFQSSSIMQEDESMRPVIFYAEGPQKGQQKTFPAQDGAFSPRKASRGKEDPSVQDELKSLDTSQAFVSEKPVYLQPIPAYLPQQQPAPQSSQQFPPQFHLPQFEEFPVPLSPRRADWADIVEGERKGAFTVDGRPSWSSVAAKISASAPPAPALPPKPRSPVSAASAPPVKVKKPKAKRVRRTVDDDDEDVRDQTPLPSPRGARGWVRSNNSGSGSGSDGLPHEWRVVTNSKKRRWRAVPAPPSAPTTPPRSPALRSRPATAPASPRSPKTPSKAHDAVPVVKSPLRGGDLLLKFDDHVPLISLPAAVLAHTDDIALRDSGPRAVLSVSRVRRGATPAPGVQIPQHPSSPPASPPRRVPASDFDLFNSRTPQTGGSEEECEFSKMWSLPPTARWADICAE